MIPVLRREVQKASSCIEQAAAVRRRYDERTHG
ncbi:hypothetical protein GA0115259_1034121 [Streptomyces sp. MnatMP-M17]|nr:hypothetical protein GA0115259_1034121 [Streptomyces sp. MnatMP-M17]